MGKMPGGIEGGAAQETFFSVDIKKNFAEDGHGILLHGF